MKNLTRTIILKLTISIFVITGSFFFLEGKNNISKIDYEKIRKSAIKESLIPIRSGIPGEIPFWNTYSRQFIYAPSFDFGSIKGAEKYKFIAKASDSLEYIFTSEKPWAELSPIWGKIPVGFVSLHVKGLDISCKVIGQAGYRKFYKASPFQGPYQDKVMNYGESAKAALLYSFNQDHIKNWDVNGVPDTVSYDLYCYPSKIIGAVIGLMIKYNKLSLLDADKAIRIAKNAADYLISISEPQGAPLEYFPPTYLGTKGAAKKYKGQYMMIYPADVAMKYLDLFDTTKDNEYFNAAVRIADTYCKIQLLSGTWKLKLWKNGEPVDNQYCIPGEIIQLLDRLISQHRLIQYKPARDNAFKWIIDNPLHTFDWSGQFEDTPLIKPYENLTKNDALFLSNYLFDRVKENRKYKDIAEELLRYSEDQFVVWEKPMPQEGKDVKTWFTPCALEQFSFYVPVDASASNFIEAYLKAYQITGKQLYWAKAIQLANALTVAQFSTGKYPTHWWSPRNNAREWMNCTDYDIDIMLRLSNFVGE